MRSVLIKLILSAFPISTDEWYNRDTVYGYLSQPVFPATYLRCADSYAVVRALVTLGAHLALYDCQAAQSAVPIA